MAEHETMADPTRRPVLCGIALRASEYPELGWPPGLGENLTVRVDESTVCIGDRYRPGTGESKSASRVSPAGKSRDAGDQTFTKEVAQTGRTGGMYA